MKVNKKFADNPKKDSFIDACHTMASEILGDAYNEEITTKTAEGIWNDYKKDDYDAKLGIFRNGLKGFSKNNRSFSITRDNESYYGQLIGTLLQSSVIAHLYHFQTKCRWCHTDMEDYYINIVPLLDQLCEGILEPLSMDLLYQNVVDQANTPTEYFEELKAYCTDMRISLFSDNEDSNYVSIMDEIINLISKTLYKLKRFDYNEEETNKVMSKTYSERYVITYRRDPVSNRVRFGRKYFDSIKEGKDYINKYVAKLKESDNMFDAIQLDTTGEVISESDYKNQKFSKTFSNKAFNGAKDAINYLESDPEIMLHESAIVDINGKFGELSMVEDPDNHEDTCIKVVVKGDDELYNLDDWDGRFDEMCYAIDVYIKQHGSRTFSEAKYEVFDHENGFAPYKNLTKDQAQEKIDKLIESWKRSNPNRKMNGRRWTIRKMKTFSDSEYYSVYFVEDVLHNNRYNHDAVRYVLHHYLFKNICSELEILNFLNFKEKDHDIDDIKVFKSDKDDKLTDKKSFDNYKKDLVSKYPNMIIDHRRIKDIDLTNQLVEYLNNRTFSESNGVEAAPQRFAVIYIPKDDKLDCNATYIEPDKDPVKCFVPDGGYNILDGKLFIKSLEINEQNPKTDCEVKVVPVAKVKLHDQIGHYSKRRFSIN